MAKRFTDTGLYEKAWFQELPNQYKLFWEYITKKCDNAGIWSINFGMVSYIFNGLELKEGEVLDIFNGRIVKIDEDKFFIPKFIKLQQKGTELNNSNLAHRQIIKLLDENSLLTPEGAWKGLTRGFEGACKGLRYSIVYISINKELKEKKINKRKEKFGKSVYKEEGRVDGSY